MSNRLDLVRLRRRITRRLEAEVRERTGPAPAELRRYELGYRRALPRAGVPIPLAELVARAARAELVFCGDYHTFRPAQSFCAALLEAMADSSSEVVLLLELARSAHQAHLDRWAEGRIGENELLRRIEYGRTWGFPWSGFRPLLELARTHGVRLVGLNGPGNAIGASLAERDAWGGEVIARVAAESPRARLLVLAGDLHLAPGHLPRAASRALAARGLKRQPFLVYQNPDQLYWRLAPQGAEPRALRLGPTSGCVFNGTPWAKLESFLTWLECGDDGLAAALGLSGEGLPDYTERILDLVELLARFLDLDADGAEEFLVHTADDLSFVTALRRAGASEREVAEILERDVAVLPELGAVWLRRLDLGHAAEAAAELFLHLVAPGPDTTRLAPAEAFAASAQRASAARFARSLIDPYARRERPASGDLAQALIASHARSWAETLAPGSSELHRELLLGDDARLGGAVARAVGHDIGDQLYAAFRAGELAPGEARSLVLGSAGRQAPLAHLLELYRPFAPAAAPSALAGTSSAPR